MSMEVIDAKMTRTANIELLESKEGPIHEEFALNTWTDEHSQKQICTFVANPQTGKLSVVPSPKRHLEDVPNVVVIHWISGADAHRDMESYNTETWSIYPSVYDILSENAINMLVQTEYELNKGRKKFRLWNSFVRQKIVEIRKKSLPEALNWNKAYSKLILKTDSQYMISNWDIIRNKIDN